jgi:hypothetical protein
MADEEFPVCPKCGGRHPTHLHPEVSEEVWAEVRHRVDGIMKMAPQVGPEIFLRLLIIMLSHAAEFGNIRTRQNVVRGLAKELGLEIVFLEPFDLATWTPPKDVN